MNADASGERVLESARSAAMEVFGDRLLSAYALGSLAHGGFNPRVSDVDLGLILADPLELWEQDRIDDVRRRVLATGLPLAERLSVFWGSASTLTHLRVGGRFPPHDVLDLMQSGRLLWGAPWPEGTLAPGPRELLCGAVECALQYLRGPAEVQGMREPSLLFARGVRTLTKRVLFPVRFLYTARTGRIGPVDHAAEHYRSLATDAVELVDAALGWRAHPPVDYSVVADVLLRHLLPLYLEFIDDHRSRLEDYGVSDLAAALGTWRADLIARPPDFGP